ncbi:MAG TPA: hypothetical protein VMH01_07945 [Puia sp.]|nr:hypothetical protein [Puia sp.]
MYKIDKACRRPDGILEMVRIRDHQLLQVDYISDENKIDDEKNNQGNVDWPFGKGQRAGGGAGCINELAV